MRRPYFLVLLLAFTYVSGQVHVRIVQKEQEEDIDDDDDINELQDVVPDVPEPVVARRKNPCHTKRCSRGEECIIENEKAKCICYRQCPDEPDTRFQVCSVRNETFPSECHLDREKCLCKTGDQSCKYSSPKKLRLDYYGACRELTSCQDWEMEQFPGRMRDWTFVVMKEMARRNQLGDYVPLLKTANADDHHTDAVIWKFCDLDIHPKDRQVNRRELLMVIATIKPMEHCLVPFLNKCDVNSDHTISLEEWGICLQLNKGDITDKCNAIHKREKRT